MGDIYKKSTTDMFVTGAELPAVTGYSAPYGNNADMETKGFEVSLGWTDSFRAGNKPFNYSVRFSLWDSKSKITKYTSKSNTLPTIYSNAYYEGMELGEIWGYHVVGLFATDEEAQRQQKLRRTIFAAQLLRTGPECKPQHPEAAAPPKHDAAAEIPLRNDLPTGRRPDEPSQFLPADRIQRFGGL